MREGLPEQGEVDVCARCQRSIVWEFDNELDPYGFWYDEEGGTEVCTPGPRDEDFYHQPACSHGEAADCVDCTDTEGDADLMNQLEKEAG